MWDKTEVQKTLPKRRKMRWQMDSVWPEKEYISCLELENLGGLCCQRADSFKYPLQNLLGKFKNKESFRKQYLLCRKWQPTPVFLPGKSHGQRRQVGNSPWGCQGSGMTEQWTSIISVNKKEGCQGLEICKGRRWLHGIIDSMVMSLSKICETVKNRETWHAAVHGVTKSWTRLSDWTTIWTWLLINAQKSQRCQSGRARGFCPQAGWQWQFSDREPIPNP